MRCVVSAVVVDLPLVPVMATSGQLRPWLSCMAARSRQNNSISPMISTSCWRASRTVQCGSGWVSGTPGASTNAETSRQSISFRLCVLMPAALACSSLAVASSKAMTSAPPATSACAASRPEPPRPKTATVLSAKVVMGIKKLSQLQRGQPRQRQHHRHDPEADDDLRFGPAQLFVVMMDRRHLEHALAGQLERHDLHDYRHGFQNEKAADDREHDLMLDGDRDGAEHAAKRERAGVAHEDRSGRCVEP